MSFSRPSLTTLIGRSEADIQGRLKGGDATLRWSIERQLARVNAGGLNGLYGNLDYLADQIMPDRADGEHLARWAGIWNVTKKAAEPAIGEAEMTGADDAVVAVDTLLQRPDGIEYRVTEAVTIVAGVASAPIEAVVPGVAGIAVTGTGLTLVSPVAGVASAATVAAPGLAGGADEESDQALLGRLLARIRQQPQGGARHDYERWALEVAGVTRAWVYPERDGLGTVGVAFVMEGREDIIPAGGDLTIVADHIDPLRPVTADVTVFALTPLPLDPSITLTPDTAEVRAAVEAELRDLLSREAVPGGTLLISHIREAISIAAGETDHVLTSPSANVTADAEEVVVLGDIDW